MPLSVLSVLARLDIDPWQEAAELARLPRETAAERLASSIAALPDRPTAHLERGTIAARLISLLPSRSSNSQTTLNGTKLDAGDVTKFRAGIPMYVGFILFMMAVQWIAASHQPLADVNTAQVPTTGTVLPETLPPYSSQ